MSLDPDLLALMPHTVTIRTTGARSAYGTLAAVETRSVQARVERQQRLVRDVAGREVVSSATVYLAEPLTVRPQDEITLPDGSRPSILSVSSVPDEKGDSYTVVYT